jgi:hypothetical protein
VSSKCVIQCEGDKASWLHVYQLAGSIYQLERQCIFLLRKDNISVKERTA